LRQILIDDLSREERDNIENYLKRTLKSGLVEGMFWLVIPDDLLAEAQQGHSECGPFYLGVEVGRDNVAFELLVRSESNLHCTCISYATKGQRDFLLAYVDRLIEEEMISA
jgi:hypothetical protein